VQAESRYQYRKVIGFFLSREGTIKADGEVVMLFIVSSFNTHD
jgi:hypothetical protein